MVNRLSDATLNGMTKKQLIEYVRMCEHNYDIAEETLRQQAENVKDWRPVKHGHWVELPKALNPDENPCQCSNCKHVVSFYYGYPKSKFCDECGAKMDGGDADETP